MSSHLLLAIAVGLLVSIALERFLSPAPPQQIRPNSAWAMHAGLWLIAYALLLAITGRPFFACIGVSVFLLLLVTISNAKFRSLREPFLFQDFRYLTDAIRFPRLYLPFLGFAKGALLIMAVMLFLGGGFWLESYPASTLKLLQQSFAVFLLGALLILACSLRALHLSLSPLEDLQRYGFVTNLFLYWRASRPLPKIDASSKLFSYTPRSGKRLPDLIAVQSESFFDPRPLYAGIRHDVLAEFDRLNTDAIQHGLLKVPAWGANTVRSEFAFLSGLESRALGAHQFNPYEAILRGWRINTLARFLQEQGYRTICIHPYHASFYRRNSVFPLIGFDEFIDIKQFDGAERFGPYISDSSLSSKVIDVLGMGDGRPHFIFVITMENHGPLHFEKVSASDMTTLYTAVPPDHWSDLAVYLRHLRNADRMIGTLRQYGEARSAPFSLCWYGDHVPIMEGVYRDLDALPTDSNYVIWNNFGGASKGAVPQDLKLDELSSIWLRSCELLK